MGVNLPYWMDWVFYLLYSSTYVLLSQDSSVGIATRFRLDGPGIESRWGRGFRTRPDRPCGPPSFLYSGYLVSFPGIKRPRRGVDHLPHLVPRLKKE